ncbi:MAG: aldo/keto reductase, partial [Deltaproteobacteria bacterium]
LETAHADGSSERQLGAVLPKLQRDVINVQTKVQPTADPARFVADFHDSLQRLQLDQVDLLALHGLNDHRSLWYACSKNGCLAASRQLQDSGIVGHIGFSGHGPTDVILDAIRHEEDGGFDYVNIHWYYIFQLHKAALEEAAARDMGVFIISPTDKGGHLQKPPARVVEMCRPLSPMLFNDLFCLSQPEIMTISVGASSPKDFDEHLKVLPLLEKKESTDLLAGIDRKWRAAMQRASGYDRPDQLWQKLPGWDQTPGYINIPMAVWLFNLARGWDLVEYAETRYRMMGTEVPWVPGLPPRVLDAIRNEGLLRDCEVEEDAILQMLTEAHRLLGKMQR